MIEGLDGLLETLEYLADDTPGGGFLRALVEDAGELLADEVRRRAPEDTGRLRDAIQASPPEPVSDGWRTEIAPGGLQPNYAVWVNDGTGIYGPHATPIVPVHAKFLRFYWKKSGQVEYRRSVRGQPGQHFFERGLEAAETELGPLFTRHLEFVWRS